MFDRHDGPTSPHPGDPSEIGGYRVLRRLGRGGMGTVYLAQAPSGRRVALKLLHPDLAEDPAFRARLAREVETARRVARFSTAEIIDARVDRTPLFVVSEFVPGLDLARAVREHGPLRGGDLEGLALGVAAALTAIHRSGVVHRDLKPANVLLSPVGPKVIDFGIARALDDTGGDITHSGQLMGTPSHMAPELLHGERAAPAADVFAWGCLVTFAGTGRTPFEAPTIPATLHNVTTAEPRLEGLDPGLLDLVRQALDKSPRNRPTAQEVLDRLMGHTGVSEEEAGRSVSAVWAPPQSPAGSSDGPGSPGRAAQVFGAPSTASPDPHGSPTPPALAGPGERRPRHRKVLVGIGAAVTTVALIGGLSYVWALAGEGPPEDLRTLYNSDFAVDPQWNGPVYDEDEAPYDSGYRTGEGIMMAYDPTEHRDPDTGRNWLAPAVPDAHATDRLLAGTDVRVIEGYDYLTFGIRCLRYLHPADADLVSDDLYPDFRDHEYSVSYRAWVRADGDEAVIDKLAGAQGDDPAPEELARGEVPDFRPYPALSGEGVDSAEEASNGEGEAPVNNSLKLACEFLPDEDGGVPTARIRLWVNDRLTVSVVDEEPHPARFTDHSPVQRHAVQFNRGQSTSPLRVLFENFRVEEIRDE